MSDVRWPRDWEADRDPLTGDYWAFSPTILARDVKEVPVYVPLRPNGTPDLDGLLARLRCDLGEVERLRAENAALRRVTEAATQEAYDKGRRDERELIIRLLQEMYARHYQMARQERDRWVRMAHYDQARAIGEAICRIAYTEWTMTDVRTEVR